MSWHTLILNVKREYFEQIKRGEKKEEYRRVCNFWNSRIGIKENSLSFVEIRCGYPKRGDMDKILSFPWRGFEIKTITHEHFGPNPVRVFAIKLEREA